MTEAARPGRASETGAALAAMGQIQALVQEMRLRDAFDTADREASRQPDSAKLSYQRGRLAELMVSEESDRAEHFMAIAQEGFGHALSLQPTNADAAGGLARILDRKGQTAEARAVLEPFLRQGLVSPMLAGAYARIGPRIGEAERACRILQQVVTLEGDSASNETLHELARLLDRLDRFDEAFAVARRANDQAAAAYQAKGFKRGELQKLVAETIRTTSRHAMLSAPPTRNRTELPVFIVGMGRSGTTLVEQIIDGHPDAHGGGERRSVMRAIQALEASTGMRSPAGIPRWPTEAVDRVAAAFLAELKALAPKAKRITDKLPQNFLRLGVIQRLFPAARIIHCRRDPRDVLLSSYFQTNKVPVMETWDLYRAAQIYRAQELMMTHWFEVLDLEILPVQYESLVQQPEIEVRRITAFLGLPWDDRCLSIEDNRRIVDTSNYASVRRKIHGDAVGRWKHYEAHLQPVIRALQGKPETDAA